MKILVLNPPYVKDFCRSARWAAVSRGRVQRHPDWILIATAELEKAGHETLFIDGPVLNYTREDVTRAVKDFKPDMAVIHTTTPSIYNDIDYAGLVKEQSGAVTVLVGPHPSVETENTFEISGDKVDAIAVGEYDYTLRDIASGMDLSEVKGVALKAGGKVIRNEPQPPVDVNKSPFPAWHHIKPEMYHDAGKRHPFITLISGRGCYGKCTFCRDRHVMYGGKLRFRDPGLVVDEIEYDLKLFPYLREIMFETDTFVASPKHVRETCEEILKRNIRISWSCNTRVDMNLDLLPVMKKAGCRMLMTGFEFGTQEGLDSVIKNTTVEQCVNFAKTAHNLGFTIHGCFMIGAPGETRESAMATINLALSLPLDTIQISGICAYPGTPIYDWAKKEGYLVPSDWTEWVSPTQEQVTLLDYPQLSKDEIDSLIDYGLKKYYLRPKQIIKMAASIRSVGDLKRKVFGFIKFLNYFCRSKDEKQLG